MAAPLGNKFWQIRSKHGVDKLFATPDLLWEAACEYFEWCDNNPLQEQKAFAFQGQVTKESVDKLRAYTMSGLCLYLGCDESYFRSFRSHERDSKKDFVTVIDQIEKTIYNQKFVGAAADLLNANIISRELGLVDKQDLTTDGKELNQIQVFQLPDNNRDT